MPVSGGPKPPVTLTGFAEHHGPSCRPAQLMAPAPSGKGLTGVEIHKVRRIRGGVGNHCILIQAFRPG